MTCQMMMSLGVYVLGAADAQERAQVGAHLLRCPECRAELARLEPLPGLLAGLPDDMVPDGWPDAVNLEAPAGRPEAPRRWRVTAAVITAAAAGLAVGVWLAPSGKTQPQATVTLSAANPATHVSAIAALTATTWGTSIQLRLRGVPLNVECRLIVRSRTGSVAIAGVWDAWHAGPVNVPASAAWLPSDIASLQVTTPAKVLVTIKRTAGAERSAGGQVAPSLGTASPFGLAPAGVIPGPVRTP
jgi:hypothetical protein